MLLVHLEGSRGTCRGACSSSDLSSAEPRCLLPTRQTLPGQTLPVDHGDTLPPIPRVTPRSRDRRSAGSNGRPSVTVSAVNGGGEASEEQGPLHGIVTGEGRQSCLHVHTSLLTAVWWVSRKRGSCLCYAKQVIFEVKICECRRGGVCMFVDSNVAFNGRKTTIS